MSNSATPWTAAYQASLSFYLQTISQSSLKFMYIESVILSNHLILCCPLLLLPSIFHGTKVFSSESAVRIRWPKYWRFSFSINLSSDYSGLISFWIDWFDLLELMQLSLSPCMDFSSCGKCQLLWCWWMCHLACQCISMNI